MSNDWFSKIESRVFTQIQYMLVKDFPSLKGNCRTTSEVITPPKFPTMYLHETQEEIGQDLTNETVNAVLSTIYIRVWTNTTEAECKQILSKATEELKRFRYNVKNLPTTQISSNIAYGEIIARRVVGNEDKDLVTV